MAKTTQQGKQLELPVMSNVKPSAGVAPQTTAVPAPLPAPPANNATAAKEATARDLSIYAAISANYHRRNK